MELLVKVGDGPSLTSFKDGDIVRAISQDDTYMCHADEKCNVTNFDFTTDGMRVPDPLLINYLENTKTYKFERLNSNEVRRTNLITNEQDILSTTPNANGEAINVYQYVARRIKSKRHMIFRENGLEYWYGHRRPSIDADSVWNSIETYSDFLKSDHARFPFSEHEKRLFLPMNSCTHGHPHDHNDLPGHLACVDCTCGCDLSECTKPFVLEREVPICNYNTVTETYLDGETQQNETESHTTRTVLHRRKFLVPYWDFTSSNSLSIIVDDVRNENKLVDERRVQPERPAADLVTCNKIEAGIVTV